MQKGASGNSRRTGKSIALLDHVKTRLIPPFCAVCQTPRLGESISKDVSRGGLFYEQLHQCRRVWSRL